MLAYTYIASREYSNARRAAGRADLYGSAAAWREALRRQSDLELERRRAGYLVGLLACVIAAAFVVAGWIAG
jgi:hypothetical protein